MEFVDYLKEALEEASGLDKGNVAKPMTDKTITGGKDLYLLEYCDMSEKMYGDSFQYVVDYKMLVDAIHRYHINTPFGLARLERGKPVTKFSVYLCVDSLGYPVGGYMHEINVALGKTSDKGTIKLVIPGDKTSMRPNLFDWYNQVLGSNSKSDIKMDVIRVSRNRPFGSSAVDFGRYGSEHDQKMLEFYDGLYQVSKINKLTANLKELLDQLKKDGELDPSKNSLAKKLIKYKEQNRDSKYVPAIDWLISLGK